MGYQGIFGAVVEVRCPELNPWYLMFPLSTTVLPALTTEI